MSLASSSIILKDGAIPIDVTFVFKELHLIFDHREIVRVKDIISITSNEKLSINPIKNSI